MITATSVQDQLAAVQDDRLRVLVVGGGIGGLTLAQLLRRDGLHPVVLERSGQDAGKGYMLGLMPLVDPVLTALGVTEEYTARSIGLDRYVIRGRTGATIRKYGVTELLSRFGDYRGISRGELLHVLGSPGGTITYGATVSAIRQRSDAARVTIDTGSTPVEADFDLVVAADGLHSTTRGLVLDASQVATYDTGWGGWVTWTDLDADSDLGEETWGVGLFAGTYPVKGKLGSLVAGPRENTRIGREPFVIRARASLKTVSPRLDSVFDEVARGDEPYYWTLSDCRSATWSVGRVVLLGDAATGFLPTAAIGACMAMESAWVLGNHLAALTPDRVPAALRDYERAQRPRVDAAQTNSRQLAGLMFNRSRLLAVVRDTSTRFVPMRVVLGQIRTLLKHQPTVAALEPTIRPANS